VANKRKGRPVTTALYARTRRRKDNNRTALKARPDCPIVKRLLSTRHQLAVHERSDRNGLFRRSNKSDSEKLDRFLVTLIAAQNSTLISSARQFLRALSAKTEMRAPNVPENNGHAGARL